MTSDQKVRNESGNTYLYPDIVVVCEKPIFHDDGKDVILNPTVILEVLSPSTENYDRGKKFFAYREMPSLKDYLLVSQDEPRIEHYTRHDHQWILSDIYGLKSSLTLTSISCTLPLAEVYDRVWEDME